MFEAMMAQCPSFQSSHKSMFFLFLSVCLLVYIIGSSCQLCRYELRSSCLQGSLKSLKHTSRKQEPDKGECFSARAMRWVFREGFHGLFKAMARCQARLSS